MGVLEQSVRLANGVLMPRIGLGTYKMTPEHIKAAVPIAIHTGYRLIDTATYYRNEKAIGQVIESMVASRAISRSDLFIQSKLATFDQGYEPTLKAVDLSLQNLGLDYIDLYIIHWPGSSKLPPADARNKELRRESWRALELLYEQGKVRSIGVSNYLRVHLEEMRQYASVLPMVNQFELHPAYQPVETIEWCREHKVAVQAYASLGEGRLLAADFLQRHGVLASCAQRCGRTVAQVLLRWAWQHGHCIIPKSISEQRIKENADIDFELAAGEMDAIDGIGDAEPFKVCWDPKAVA